jgi:RNA polymerase sporulation-specific sigma factor
MLLTLLQFFATKFLVLALHLEAGSFPKPLSAREEVETFAALRAGDPTARETLIRHNLRLVVHVAKKYYAQPSDQEDLISIGTIGLMKAVDTFDSTRKARFSTYASRCIENAILNRANAGWRIGTTSTAIGGILVLFRVYREGGPVDLILR